MTHEFLKLTRISILLKSKIYSSLTDRERLEFTKDWILPFLIDFFLRVTTA